jgi:hypothetical protein
MLKRNSGTVRRSGSQTTHRASIQEESAIPAQLLHGELKNRGLRDGSVIDAEGSPGSEEVTKAARHR